MASTRPDSSAAMNSLVSSMVTGVKEWPLLRKKSAMLSSPVVPLWMPMVAPSRSAAFSTPTSLRTRMPWPS